MPDFSKNELRKLATRAQIIIRKYTKAKSLRATIEPANPGEFTLVAQSAVGFDKNPKYTCNQIIDDYVEWLIGNGYSAYFSLADVDYAYDQSRSATKNVNFYNMECYLNGEPTSSVVSCTLLINDAYDEVVVYFQSYLDPDAAIYDEDTREYDTDFAEDDEFDE